MIASITDQLLAAMQRLCENAVVRKALAAGQSATCTRTVTIPSGPAAGSFYMGATATGPSRHHCRTTFPRYSCSTDRSAAAVIILLFHLTVLVVAAIGVLVLGDRNLGPANAVRAFTPTPRSRSGSLM